MKETSCNILIIGKSGAGKSTLLKRIFKINCKTGTGKPVTTQGVHCYQVTVGSMKTLVFDSWGIEAGSTGEWKKLFDQTLKQHGIDQPPEDWFHSIVYCIDASGARIQTFDTNIIKELSESGFRFLIAFTKADLATDAQQEKLKADLVKTGVDLKKILFVSSGGETRFQKTLPFGIDELKKQMFSGLQETIVQLLPQRCKKLLEEEIDNFTCRCSRMIDALDIAFSDNTENMDLIRKEAVYFQRIFKEYILPEIVNRELTRCFDISRSMLEEKQFYPDDSSGISPKDMFWKKILSCLLLFKGLKYNIELEELLDPDTFWELSSSVKNRMKKYTGAISEKMKEQCSSIKNHIGDIIKQLILNEQQK